MRGFRNVAIYPRRPNLSQARPRATGQTPGGRQSESHSHEAVYELTRQRTERGPDRKLSHALPGKVADDAIDADHDEPERDAEIARGGFKHRLALFDLAGCDRVVNYVYRRPCLDRAGQEF